MTVRLPERPVGRTILQATAQLPRHSEAEDDPALTYAYPSCLFLDDVAFVTHHVTPEPAPGQPFTSTRSLRAMHLPLAWLYA